MIKNSLYLWIILAIVLSVTTGGCSSSNNDIPFADSNGQIIDGKTKMKLLSAMEKVLNENSERFSYLDLELMRNDPELHELYDRLFLEVGQWTVETLGFEIDQVTQIFDSDVTQIFEGDFDYASIEDFLESSSRGQQDYKGITMWQLESYNVPLWEALANDLIIMGLSTEGIMSCIDVLDNEAEALSKNKEFESIIGYLPNGFAFVCEKGVFNDYDYEGLSVSATSVGKKDENTVLLTGILKFVSAEAGTSAMEEIRDTMENDDTDDWESIVIDKDDIFVKVTAEENLLSFIGE